MIPRRSIGHRYIGGFTLIELMIAMMLGVMVMGAAISMFLTNRQTYRATESMSRSQETARIAFELLARDVREAGGNACDVGLPVVNVLSSNTATWWKNWAQPVIGFVDTGVDSMKTGTDALQILSAGTGGATLSTHDASGTLTLQGASSDLASGQVMVLCDRQEMALFQAKAYSSGGKTITYDTSGLNACSKFGRFPSVCNAAVNTYSFERNAIVTPLYAVQWYVGTNSRGGTSLYQRVLSGNNATPSEVAEGVTNLQLQYLVTGGSTYIDTPTDWNNVLSVKITLTVATLDKVGTDGQPIVRDMTTIASIRNRNP